MDDFPAIYKGGKTFYCVSDDPYIAKRRRLKDVIPETDCFECREAFKRGEPICLACLDKALEVGEIG